MKIFFDTEFIVHPGGVTLLALGAVREDGLTFYAENGDADITLADDWVQANVIPKLTGPVHTIERIARDFKQFIGPTPELWAYFCTYDHWLVMQMFGGWFQTPEPARVCHDLATLFVLHKVHAEAVPATKADAVHHAYADAEWVRDAYAYIMGTV